MSSRVKLTTFCENNVHQTSLSDTINQMPKYLQDILKNSWAQTFRYYIFPSINDERFSPSLFSIGNNTGYIANIIETFSDWKVYTLFYHKVVTFFFSYFFKLRIE